MRHPHPHPYRHGHGNWERKEIIAATNIKKEPTPSKKTLGNTILHQIDQQLRLQTDITAKITLIQSRVLHGSRKFEMVYYRRDKDDAFLIVMLAPNTEKGNGYLKIGKNFWMYRKNTRTFQHISRDENIGGTDLQGGDLEQRKMTDLYAVNTNSNNKRRRCSHDTR